MPCGRLGDEGAVPLAVEHHQAVGGSTVDQDLGGLDVVDAGDDFVFVVPHQDQRRLRDFLEPVAGSVQVARDDVTEVELRRQTSAVVYETDGLPHGSRG